MITNSEEDIMRVAAVSTLALSLLLAGSGVSAQSPGSLVGSWERFSLKDSTGAVTQPPLPAAFTIFAADGFYAQIAIPANRPKVSKPLADHTKDELLNRFRNVEARRGRYTVKGDTLTRTYVASVNPNSEGQPAQAQRFRIDGEVLILTSLAAGNKSEARFRRAR